MLVDPAQLVTLTDASVRLERAVNYFRQQRYRYPDGFPAPIAFVGGADVFVFDELIEWDRRRLAR